MFGFFHNKTNTAAMTAAVCTQRFSEEFAVPRGSSPKREHEYEKLKDEFKKDHRYPGREEEVAARIVNKQRKQAGETKDQ